MSGSTKRPEQPPQKPSEPGRGGVVLEGLTGPIDLRSRVAGRSGVHASGSSTSARVASASVTGPFSLGSAWSRLVDSLAGDVILTHVPGRRVLDLGYGSPEISGWVKARIGDHLSIVEKGALDQAAGKVAETSGFLPASQFLDADGNLMIPEEGEDEPSVNLAEYPDANFDVVYCLRTFPHLGYDTSSSERLGCQLLREAARVTVDGGEVFVQIANPRSLRGIVEGIRNPITVVSRRRMILGDRYGLTRWDTIPRFLRFLPPELEFVRVHGLGVLIPHNATLHIPLVGSVLSRLEWRLRDLALFQRFGAQVLVVLRRVHRGEAAMVATSKPGPALSL
ncbi:class I SAM-dependent methyltransferase [Enhygromyxa salina]|uniref:class I SAM-dependent methyltransferase n=1 Tax=Enhygromyxa salina TaxID=215803 RepID=UPI0011B278CF|nr:class I SAM-dependent methyltransferase [Enhygromyxa salina]